MLVKFVAAVKKQLYSEINGLELLTLNSKLTSVKLFQL